MRWLRNDDAGRTARWRLPNDMTTNQAAPLCGVRPSDGSGNARTFTSWLSLPCRRIPAFVPPLPVRDRLPVVPRGRPLLDLVALAQPATGLATPGDFLSFPESAGLSIADAGSIHAGVHKKIVRPPCTQRALSFNKSSAHQYHSLPNCPTTGINGSRPRESAVCLCYVVGDTNCHLGLPLCQRRNRVIGRRDSCRRLKVCSDR